MDCLLVNVFCWTCLLCVVVAVAFVCPFCAMCVCFVCGSSGRNGMWAAWLVESCVLLPTPTIIQWILRSLTLGLSWFWLCFFRALQRKIQKECTELMACTVFSSLVCRFLSRPKILLFPGLLTGSPESSRFDWERWRADIHVSRFKFILPWGSWEGMTMTTFRIRCFYDSYISQWCHLLFLSVAGFGGLAHLIHDPRINHRILQAAQLLFGNLCVRSWRVPVEIVQLSVLWKCAMSFAESVVIKWVMFFYRGPASH